MPKIAAFIIPNKVLKKEIIKYKKNVKKKLGNQIYLNHLPHCSIFTMNVTKQSFFEKSLKKSITHKSRFTTYNVYKKSIFNFDPITKNKTIFLKIRKNKYLTDLQLLLLKKIQNFRKNEKSPKFKFRWMEDNYKKFGYPFVKKRWNPHFTIASIKKSENSEKFISKFLNKKFNSFPSEKINKIYIYNILKKKHKLLWKINLKN